MSLLSTAVLSLLLSDAVDFAMGYTSGILSSSAAAVSLSSDEESSNVEALCTFFRWLPPSPMLDLRRLGARPPIMPSSVIVDDPRSGRDSPGTKKRIFFDQYFLEGFQRDTSFEPRGDVVGADRGYDRTFSLRHWRRKPYHRRRGAVIENFATFIAAGESRLRGYSRA